MYKSTYLKICKNMNQSGVSILSELINEICKVCRWEKRRKKNMDLDNDISEIVTLDEID